MGFVGGSRVVGLCLFKEPSFHSGGKKKKLLKEEEEEKNHIGYSLHSKEHYQNIFQLRHENRKQQKNFPSTSEETQRRFM